MAENANNGWVSSGSISSGRVDDEQTDMAGNLSDKR